MFDIRAPLKNLKTKQSKIKQNKTTARSLMHLLREDTMDEMTKKECYFFSVYLDGVKFAYATNQEYNSHSGQGQLWTYSDASFTIEEIIPEKHIR